MLRPADCVANRGGHLRARCSSERMRHFVKKVRRNAADFLDHLGRVTGEMPFYLLKDTLRILQCEVAVRSAQIAAFIKPAVAFVSALLRVPAGEVSILVVFWITIFVGQDAGGIRVMDNVIAKEKVVFNEMPDESPEKHNVCARADWHPNVGQGAGARKTWIHMDDCGAVLLGLHHPAKTDRMRLRHG